MKPLQKLGAVLTIAPMLAVGFVALGPTSPASASSCGVGVMCGDDGGGGGKPGGGGTKPGGGANPPGGGGGGGSSAPADPYAYSTISTYAPTVNSCAVRDDGKKAKAARMNFTTEFATTSGWDVKPSWGTGWNARGSFSHGHVWDRVIFTGKDCLYPSRTYTKVIKCSIRYYVAVDKTAPNSKRLATASNGTGYTEGSKNYNACIASAGSASISQAVKEYGFYKVSMWQRAANATVEVAYTKDELTGQIAAPKIIELSPAYNTAPKQGMTGSLDCKNGWKSPGIIASDWTADACKGGVGKAPFVCSAPNGVLLDGADEGVRDMRKFAPGSTVELPNNHRGRLVQFDQRIVGNGLTVNSYSTQFTRAGTPWSASEPLNRNLVEMAQTPTSPGLLTSASGTGKISGNDKTVYVWGYQASNPGGKTTVTQKLDWTGTQRIQSVKITSINPNTGKITTAPITVTVPASGSCSQSIGLKYTRSVGDSR